MCSAPPPSRARPRAVRAPRLPVAERAVFALLLVALMMRWAEDPGGPTSRSLRCWASPRWRSWPGGRSLPRLRSRSACSSTRPASSSGCRCSPALWLDQGRWRAVGRRAASAGAVLGACVAALFAFDLLPHADARTMVDGRAQPFADRTSTSTGRSISRSAARAACRRRCARTPAIRPMRCMSAAGLLVIGALHRDPGTARRARAGRPRCWCRCRRSSFSAWSPTTSRAGPCSPHSTSGCCAPSGRVAHPNAAPPALAAAGASRSAALVIPLIHPKTWPIEDPIFAPTPVIERLARRLGGPATPRFRDVLERCDPGWRSVLDDAPGTSARNR